MARKVVDCREHPSQQNCSLTISGEENDVLQAVTQHAVSMHGEKDTPELRKMIRDSMKDEMETTTQKAS